MIRPAGILVPTGSGRLAFVAGFGQISSQVLKVGMSAEMSCASRPFVVIPMVIIGTIMGGYGSPTEAAALGALCATILGLFFTKTLKISDFGTILLRTGINSALVLFLVAAAGVFSWVLVFGEVPHAGQEHGDARLVRPHVGALVSDLRHPDDVAGRIETVEQRAVAIELIAQHEVQAANPGGELLHG
jgi:hypothetical protein